MNVYVYIPETWQDFKTVIRYYWNNKQSPFTVFGRKKYHEAQQEIRKWIHKYSDERNAHDKTRKKLIEISKKYSDLKKELV